jgi:hypothetical protein
MVLNLLHMAGTTLLSSLVIWVSTKPFVSQITYSLACTARWDAKSVRWAHCNLQVSYHKTPATVQQTTISAIATIQQLSITPLALLTFRTLTSAAHSSTSTMNSWQQISTQIARATRAVIYQWLPTFNFLIRLSRPTVPRILQKSICNTSACNQKIS